MARCKPGILAFINDGGPIPENYGVVVEVLEVHRYTTPEKLFWQVRTCGPAYQMMHNWKTGEYRDKKLVGAGHVGAVQDACLTPISGVPVEDMEEERETAR